MTDFSAAKATARAFTAAFDTCAADMRVVNIYRRGGGKPAESRGIIDRLHVLKMQGLGGLERLNSGVR